MGTAFFLIAATPDPVFDYAGLIAGASELDARRFRASTFACKMTQVTVIAVLGHMVGGQLGLITYSQIDSLRESTPQLRGAFIFILFGCQPELSRQPRQPTRNTPLPTLRL